MNIREVLDAALETTHGNQAELGRRLRRSGPAITRWLDGSNKPDLESCLRLAAITGMPHEEVLLAAGFDPSILPGSEGKNLTPIEQDVLRRVRRLQAALDATEGIPDKFVEAVLMPMLDGTEESMLATIESVRLMRRSQSALSTTDTNPLSTQPEPANADSARLGKDLGTRKEHRQLAALVVA